MAWSRVCASVVERVGAGGARMRIEMRMAGVRPCGVESPWDRGNDNHEMT